MFLRRVHAAATWLFVVAIVVQVFLAGAALANLGGSGNFGTHIEFGYTGVFIVWVVLFASALAARPGRREIGYVLVIFLLYMVQTVLPSARATAPSVAALHPVNALLLFGLAVWYARRASRAVMA